MSDTDPLSAAAAADNRREYFRLRYPEADRPRLLLGHLTAFVAELSETGLRVVGDHEKLWVGSELAGRVLFADGTVIGVNATILRREADETILKLRTAVPFRRLMIEQRRVRFGGAEASDE